MRAPRAVIVLLAFSLLLAGVIVPAASASDGVASTTTAENGSSTPSIERPDPYTVITINVTDDGDARWIVTSRFVVETANETSAFGALSETVANGGNELGYSVETFRRAATLSERSTDREMAIQNVTWTSQVENETGSLSLRFTWTNFGRVQNDRVVVDDAFSTDEGTWLPWLADGQKLVINPPAEYAPIDTPPDRGPVNGSLMWNGPREFDPGYFSIVYVPSMGPGSPTPTTQPGTTPGGQSQQTSPLFWFGVVLLVVAVGAGGYFYAVQRRGDAPASGTAAEAKSGDETGSPAATNESDDAATTETADETARPSPSATVGEAGAGATTGDGDDSEPEGEDDDGIDPELLSDEERVERLLERNGGRMKQAKIVKETGWSNAKVSQLLSSMAEEDRINKLRIGRENLITLPDEDVTDF